MARSYVEMKAILFIGIQATGKSTFFQQCFFATHVRLNLDMLKTRNRERILFKACLEAKQPFVLDNTNLTREARADYLAQAKAAGFGVTGYYFQSSLAAAIERNNQRTGKAQIPLKGLLAAHRKLEVPSLDEGFNQLWYVQIGDQVGNGEQFIVEEWNDEIR